MNRNMRNRTQNKSCSWPCRNCMLVILLLAHGHVIHTHTHTQQHPAVLLLYCSRLGSTALISVPDLLPSAWKILQTILQPPSLTLSRSRCVGNPPLPTQRHCRIDSASRSFVRIEVLVENMSSCNFTSKLMYPNPLDAASLPRAVRSACPKHCQSRTYSRDERE